MIYFVQHRDSYIKIGQTSDLETRLMRLRDEYGDGLEVLGVMEGARSQEKHLHRQFAHLKRFGEWYTPAADLLTYIHASTTPLVAPASARPPQIPAPMAARLVFVRLLYFEHYPDGMSDGELAQRLGTSRMTACRYRLLLGAVKVAQGKYLVLPSEQDIEQALTTLKTALCTDRLNATHVLKLLGEHE
jgi:hypothetical protein